MSVDTITQTWTVSGMSCEHCVASVTEEVEVARSKLNGLEQQLGRVSDQMNASIGRVMVPNQWAADMPLSLLGISCAA